MKKILYIMFVVGLIVSSCGKKSNSSTDPDTDQNTQPVEATFSGSITTRATGDTWKSSDKIGVYAFDASGSIYDAYSNIPYTTASGGTQATFAAAGSTSIYYPTSGDKLTFIAYSPYQSIGTDGLYDIDIATQTAPEDIELMVSNSGTSYTQTSPSVALKFSYALAKLSLKIEAGGDLVAADMNDITIAINGVATQSTYELTSGNFSAESPIQTLAPRQVTNGAEYEAVLIPGSYSDLEVTFTLSNGISRTWNASEDADFVLASAELHTHNVTISENKIEVSAGTISGWGDGADDGDVFETERASYPILSADDLKAFAESVNSGTSYDQVTIKLYQDIDLEGSDSNQWTPIGGSNQFLGIFDGNGYTISGIYIDSTSGDQGFFGVVADNATIMNLTVEGYIKSTAGTVGGIAGYSGSGSVIKNCENRATVEAGGSRCGGIVGYSGATITECCNSGDINGNSSFGGIVGDNLGSITNCYNIGTISGTGACGGIVGQNEAVIANCYNIGYITSTSSMTGGIVGTTPYNPNASLTNSYTLTDVVNSTSSGSDGTIKTESEMKESDFITSLNNGQKPESWIADYDSPNQINDGYPILSWQ
ncbi:MAG: fimbrillin family protein [Rikenellaceae bacterium]